jgi:hypothetical protein
MTSQMRFRDPHPSSESRLKAKTPRSHPIKASEECGSSPAGGRDLVTCFLPCAHFFKSEATIGSNFLIGQGKKGPSSVCDPDFSLAEQ